MFKFICENCNTTKENYWGRYCPQCGSIVTSVEVQNHNLDLADNLTQTSIRNLPKICASGRSVIVPDSKENKFQVYTIQNSHSPVGQSPNLRKQFQNGISVNGDIFESSDPVFDGLYFSFLNGNRLYRVAAEENVEKTEIVSDIPALPYNFPKSETLLIVKDILRLLVFQNNDNLIFLDLRTDDNNLSIKQKAINGFKEHGEKVHLLYSEETGCGYFVTRNANVYKFDPSGFVNDNISFTQLPANNFGSCEVISLKMVDGKIKLLVRKDEGDIYAINYELLNGQCLQHRINHGFSKVSATQVIITGEHTLIKNTAYPNQFIKIFNDGRFVNTQINDIHPDLAIECNNRIFSVDRTNRKLNILSEDGFRLLAPKPLVNGLYDNFSISQVFATNNFVYILTDEHLRVIQFK